VVGPVGGTQPREKGAPVNMRYRWFGGGVVACLAMAGCSNFGPQQVPADQFDYNKAIARSMQEQMLLNVVRVHYFEVPVFLAVSSVLTQYAWQGTVGVAGQQGFSIGGGLQAPSKLTRSSATSVRTNSPNAGTSRGRPSRAGDGPATGRVF
jgi:hypothetical protein